MDDFIFEYTNDNIEDIVNEKYKYFVNNIKNMKISINGKSVEWKRYPLIDNKDATFFHLITKDYHDKDGYCCPNSIIKCDRNFKYNPMMSDNYDENSKRTICGHRIQCLYLLPEYFLNDDIKVWSREESTPMGLKTRIKALDIKNKYVVIFDERHNGKIFFWTSYPINDDKISHFIKEYEANKDNRKNIITINK